MTRALAEQRTAAWQNHACRDVDAPWCRQEKGRRCLAEDGKTRVPPHPARVALEQQFDAGAASRQGEVDQRDVIITGHAESLRVITAERNTLRDQVRSLTSEVTGLTEQVRVLTRDVEITMAEKATAEKRYSDHMATAHPTVPAPTTARTRFGACPQKGGESLAAAQTVIAKWGKGAAVRQFLGTGVAPRPADASVVHISWKPTLAQITDAWVKSVTANLREGDCVEVWHELDKKITDKVLTQADGEARKNRFFDCVMRVRPDLLVVDTRTGWSFDPKSGKNPRAIKVRAHVLGVDCDGVRPTKLPYTNYEAETATALAIIAEDDNDYEWFAVPEFGCPRIPAADPDGMTRAEYHDFYARTWKATGKCLFVTLYEYNSSPNYSLDLPAEQTGFRAHVA